MEEKEFKIRAYGYSELAQLYLPNVHPKSAANQFRKWIYYNPKLLEALKECAYKKRTKIFTPVQVTVIIKFLGEP